jgi:hypothetical protein
MISRPSFAALFLSSAKQLGTGEEFLCPMCGDPCYVWRDDERVHAWAEDGYGGWDDSSWDEGRTHPHNSWLATRQPCEPPKFAMADSTTAPIRCSQQRWMSGTRETGCDTRQDARADRFKARPAEIRSLWSRGRGD